MEVAVEGAKELDLKRHDLDRPLYVAFISNDIVPLFVTATLPSCHGIERKCYDPNIGIVPLRDAQCLGFFSPFSSVIGLSFHLIRLNQMEGGESILDVLKEEDNFEYDEDIEMVDVEEGELVEDNSRNDPGQSNAGDVDINNQESQGKNRRRRANKKKNKRKRSGLDPNVMDVDRFVLDTCRRLKEKKSYMVYTAVGCLGISALRDLIKEVAAVQACGGQMTADGRRFRTGGGILWSIIKAREPKAYKEIMSKAKEFEKQFKRPNLKQATGKRNDGLSENVVSASMNITTSNVSDALQVTSKVQNQHEQSNDGEKRVSVCDRLRIPVSYDDDLLGGDPKDASS